MEVILIEEGTNYETHEYTNYERANIPKTLTMLFVVFV